MKSGISSFYDALDNIEVTANNNGVEYPHNSIKTDFLTPTAASYDIGEFYAKKSDPVDYPTEQIWYTNVDKIVRSKADILY